MISRRRGLPVGQVRLAPDLSRREREGSLIGVLARLGARQPRGAVLIGAGGDPLLDDIDDPGRKQAETDHERERLEDAQGPAKAPS